MKIEKPIQQVISNGGKSQEFTIAASTKAFKILSSNLYQNKIRAIVRELSCNAYDAQKLNGSTEQIIIKAPTAFSPNFEIRDFGPGLSDEDVKTLYTTYFESTKAESNEFIGALGLGSKSPFSYTDVFTVISHHGGKERAYLCMIDNGIPNLRALHVKDSNSTGLHIIVPVQPKDYETFEDEIYYVVSPFPKGTFTVDGSFDFPESEYFNIPKSSLFDQINAIYGNIVYPLSKTPGIRFNALVNNQTQVFFRFELGELDITPSREELSFDEQTVKVILDKVNAKNAEVIAEYRSKYLDLVAQSKFRQAMKLAYDMPNSIKSEALLNTPELSSALYLKGLEYIKIYNEKWRLEKPKAFSDQFSSFMAIHNETHSIVVADDKYTISSLADNVPYNSTGHIIIDPKYLDDYLKIFEGDDVNITRASEIKTVKKAREKWACKVIENGVYEGKIDPSELEEDDFLLFETRNTYHLTNPMLDEYRIDLSVVKQLGRRIVIAPLSKRSLKAFKGHQQNNARIIKNYFENNSVVKSIDVYFISRLKFHNLLGFIVDRFSTSKNEAMLSLLNALSPEDQKAISDKINETLNRELDEYERIRSLNPVIIKLLKEVYLSDLNDVLIENIKKLWVES